MPDLLSLSFRLTFTVLECSPRPIANIPSKTSTSSSIPSPPKVTSQQSLNDTQGDTSAPTSLESGSEGRSETTPTPSDATDAADILLSFSRSRVETRAQKAIRAQPQSDSQPQCNPTEIKNSTSKSAIKAVNEVRDVGGQSLDTVKVRHPKPSLKMKKKQRGFVFYDSNGELQDFKPKPLNQGASLRMKSRGRNFAAVQTRGSDSSERNLFQQSLRGISLPPPSTFNTFNSSDVDRRSSTVPVDPLASIGWNLNHSAITFDFEMKKTQITQENPNVDPTKLDTTSTKVPFQEKRNFSSSFSSCSSLSDEEEEIVEKKSKRAKINDSSSINSDDLEQSATTSTPDSDLTESSNAVLVINNQMENVSISDGTAQANRRLFPKHFPIHHQFPGFYQRYHVPSSLAPSQQVAIFGGSKLSE